MKYLETAIAETRETTQPRWGIAADGYTYRSGAPSNLLVRLEGETRWRRLMFRQFSNVGSYFLKIDSKEVPVSDWQIPPTMAR